MTDICINKINDLKQEIMSVFPKRQPPSPNQITVDRYFEGSLVSECLEGKHWWEIEDQTLETVSDSIALLTPVAFHYYLPALLLYALNNFNDRFDNQVFAYTIYNLSPVKTLKEDPRFFDRFRLFTIEQVMTIRKFLELVVEGELWRFYKDAERGLKKFWSI